MAGLYLHIPFCKRFCSYCDFYSTIKLSYIDDYIDALIKEIDLCRDYLAGAMLSTIYFGGGTPSLIAPDKLKRLIDFIRSTFKVYSKAEITIEINPDDIDKSYLEQLKELGFNRLSIGVQSWDDRILSYLNRRHSAAKAESVVENCKIVGFDNISIDIMYGIPTMSFADWERTVDKTLSFDIQHLSAYCLSIEPNTKFGRLQKLGKLETIDDDLSVKEYHLLMERGEASGFVHYEISNFCKPNLYSKHNTSYWKQTPYLGVGAGAHSFNGFERRWNIENVNRYIKGIQTDKPIYGKEIITLPTRFNEYIMTSLRTIWGIDLQYIEEFFGSERKSGVVAIAEEYIKYGYLIRENNIIKLSRNGIFVSDGIIADLMVV